MKQIDICEKGNIVNMILWRTCMTTLDRRQSTAFTLAFKRVRLPTIRREDRHAFLAHLSRRLIGELIVYPWSGVRRRPSVVRRSQCSNIFFSETAWPIKAKFYVEPPWVGGTIFCSRHLGHMTKMAATPIYGKKPFKIFFSRTGRQISTKLGM